MRFRLLCGFLLVCQLCFAATEKTIYSFSEFSHGESPFTNVTFDSAGNIYGTTCFGGTHNDGTVFKLTPGKNGSYTQTVLYSFSGSDGACPASGVVLDSAGNIYGTASTGGNKSTTCFQTAGCGVVFKLTPNGTTWKQQILYKFSGSDASYPSSLAWYPGGNLVGTAGPPSPNWNGIVFMLTPSGTAWNFTTLFSFPATGFANGLVGPLVVDSSGNLYGVTTYGGTFNEGIVFELSYSGNQLVESVLHSFTRGGDGNSPTAGLSIDQAGNLYGSAPSGGTLGYGSIFKLTRDTQSNWNEAVIYNFQSVTDGWAPQGGVVLDGAGNVYGTTAAGGSTSCSCGTAFELSPNSNGAYTKKTIHNFSGYAGSQLGTLAAMVFDSQGNLYGTTPDGNGHLNVSDGGTVYRLSPGSSGWTYTVLYGFPASDGHGPGAGLTFDSAGNLYGTTTSGGLPEAGTVYELSPAGNGVWTEKLLYSFYGGNDGATPYSNIVIDSSGNLFGTTKYGGGGSSSGFGTVFELSPNGTGWKETILHAFQSNGTDGTWPLVGLTRDASGNLFGATYNGGTYGFGTVFKMTMSSSGTWSESVLYSFTGGADGSQPEAPITIDSAGNLYGSTVYGGAHSVGAIFVLSPKADGSYAESVLHSFTGSSDGDNPRGNLTLDAEGNLYGVAANVAFELSPSSSGSWTETVLYTFGKNGDVSYPGGLAFDASGNLWGTAGGGGASKDGGVFELSPSGGQWKETQLIVFSGLLGIGPTGNVIFDGAGNLYGVGYKGGNTGDGVVFEITP
jgi:uncharacterized repeat protein (TIGR03803 family)